MNTAPLHLFEGFGVELEYMLVDRRSLDVLPVTDEVIKAVTGEFSSDVEFDDISWSNELALHVVELKTSGPVAHLEPLPEAFARHAAKIDALLGPLAGRLLPSGMHPWMNPDTEMKLWPHHYGDVYAAFDRIFDCRGHGWANLQSVHLNLPFADDREFARLHAAVRLLLPILPALAASSPIKDGQISGLLDTRLDVYRHNCRAIPSVTGRVIPEPVFSISEYHEHILQPMYADIAPHDPEKLLQEEYLNARGAIARFVRNAIEIRVLDVQECPLADVAICAAIVEVLRSLVDERWSTLNEQSTWMVDPLESIFSRVVRDAEAATIDNADYLRMFGYNATGPITAGELWRHLLETACYKSAVFPQRFVAPLEVILREGPLARRILRAVGEIPSRERLWEVYQRLADCPLQNRQFM